MLMISSVNSNLVENVTKFNVLFSGIAYAIKETPSITGKVI
jgi:hypothetical protein